MISQLFVLLIFLSASQLAAAETEWATVVKGEGHSGLSVSGRVIPQDGALNIESARVQGRVLSLLRREGERVSEGLPLYAVSSPECFSLQEESRVANEKKIVDLQDGVKKRERQLGLKLTGDRCEIVATHAGVLTKRNLESGSAFNVGDVLATVLDTKRLTVELEIPEKDESLVKAGQSVTLQFASGPGKDLNAKIQDVVPTIDPTTRTLKARLTGLKLPSTVGLEALVTADIKTDVSRGTRQVPSSALVFFRNRRFVIVGGNEKTARAVAVDVLNESETLSSVRSRPEEALRVGDQVAVKGAIYLIRKIMAENLP